MESGTSYQPLERRKVYEQISEQLLAQIGSRRLKPGDALPSERELTQSFGVGRSSIREALRMLESRGVITAANGGTFVVADASNPLESSLRLQGFLCAKSRRSKKPVLHVTNIEFIEGD